MACINRYFQKSHSPVVQVSTAIDSCLFSKCLPELCRKSLEAVVVDKADKEAPNVVKALKELESKPQQKVEVKQEQGRGKKGGKKGKGGKAQDNDWDSANASPAAKQTDAQQQVGLAMCPSIMFGAMRGGGVTYKAHFSLG